MDNIFTIEEVNGLSAEINRQLQELAKASPLDIKSGGSGGSGGTGGGGRVGGGGSGGSGGTKKTDRLPVKQSQVVAEITQEDPKTFLKTFLAVAKDDLCEEGGLLYGQWKKWADLNNKDVIEKFTAILVALGFTGNTLPILVVAVAVIVIHLGVKTFCMYYSQ